MANYPSTLPAFPATPAPNETLGGSTPTLRDMTTLITGEVSAIATELGTNPSGPYATLVARLTAIEGASAATTLDGLTDATITAPSNGQVLTYNSATSQWTNQAAGAGADTMIVTVTADGATDAAPTIQAVLDNLSTSTHSRVVRIEPSPKNSMPPSTHKGVDGKMKGMALEATRCPIVIGCCSARRPGRLQSIG